jgi:hypothetical protein
MPGLARTVYVVVRNDWSYNDEYYTGGNEPLKAFTDREQAEAYLARCERRAMLEWEDLMASQTDLRHTILEMEIEAET